MNSKQNDSQTLAKGVNNYCLENCHQSSINRSSHINLIDNRYQQNLIKNQHLGNTTLLGLSIFLAVFGTGIITWIHLARLRKKLKNHSSDYNLNYSPSVEKKSIPCKKCQYFHRNDYLQCAVQPSKVLTTEATKCCDYTLHSNKNN